MRTMTDDELLANLTPDERRYADRLGLEPLDVAKAKQTTNNTGPDERRVRTYATQRKDQGFLVEQPTPSIAEAQRENHFDRAKVDSVDGPNIKATDAEWTARHDRLWAPAASKPAPQAKPSKPAGRLVSLIER